MAGSFDLLSATVFKKVKGQELSNDMDFREMETFIFNKDTYLPQMPSAFLVEGILHRSQTLVFGQTNAGKSMLALSLATSVASGHDWNGRAVTEKGPVAIISGDPDGKYENYERLNKVREDVGDGEIRICVPKRPLSPAAWYEIHSIVNGCKLVIIDNLTQFVPGTLSDDYAVKMIYENINEISRDHPGVSVCVLAHASDAKNEWGYSSNRPSGSFVIRSVPRWFVYMKRSSGVLTMDMSGNSGGRPWRMKLSEPSDRPRFETLQVLGPDELDEEIGRRNRSRKTLDKRAQYREFADSNPDMTQAKIAANFGVSTATINRALKGR